MARILVIDDDAETRAMLEQTLASAGHEVVSAADGKQGVELFRTRPAKLVITDLFMPHQEGIETIVQLRRDFPELPIIAISGNPDAADMLTVARRLGAVKTLEKPFQPQELLSAVAEVLQARP